MHRSDTHLPAFVDAISFGELVCRIRTALPHAIHSLDDEELRVLLIAMLKEWRDRQLFQPDEAS